MSGEGAPPCSELLQLVHGIVFLMYFGLVQLAVDKSETPPASVPGVYL